MISINRFLIRKGFKSNDEKITILQMVELVDQWQRQVPPSLGDFKDWINEVVEFDKTQSFMLDSEVLEWYEWYKQGLTPQEANELNFKIYG